MLHDLHHIYCDCGLAEFGEDCAAVRKYADQISDPRKCDQCGARIMIRALEFRSALVPGGETASLATILKEETALLYEASAPMPLATWLASFHPEAN